MWGEGGRFYWGRKDGREGIVVVFAWLSSQERHLKPFIELYSSFGWSSLICHADFLTLFFPEKATLLADGVLKELVKEVKIRPLPITLVAFSGGAKGCMYKVLQLIDGKCEGQLSLDEYQLVRDCVCGQIYDSSPVDFTSDLGTRFVLHPSILKMSHPPRVVSWMAKALASGLDTLFINRFEAQRAEYWQTLYSSANMGPFLIFCSDDDELAPYPVVCTFTQRLQELGGDVKLIKWNSSPHVGHYKHHPVEYKAAVSELLCKAALVHSERRQQSHGETACAGGSSNEIPESVCSLHKAAVTSNESLRRVAIDPTDHFFLPSSMEYEAREDEKKGESFHMQNVPSINAHGVLGQILFDVCVPKNVEGWDIKPITSLNGRQSFASARRHGLFNPIKCIRRSRL
ncbi:uncharacterized protein [Elaeis guineensis]|uniref:Uncharacterized protein LOC105041376 isoform X2 n=1 Tax=Elaeis guineensis var. tenera TaxID=51953 RepID=A0A6I9QX05_ELAGV|nr:uncharacterized protein LOC105041376 isoform X2 [Elaeis guineensis]